MFVDGKFAAYMQVHIQNDGPVTIQLESIPDIHFQIPENRVGPRAVSNKMCKIFKSVNKPFCNELEDRLLSFQNTLTIISLKLMIGHPTLT